MTKACNFTLTTGRSVVINLHWLPTGDGDCEGVFVVMARMLLVLEREKVGERSKWFDFTDLTGLVMALLL